MNTPVLTLLTLLTLITLPTLATPPCSSTTSCPTCTALSPSCAWCETATPHCTNTTTSPCPSHCTAKACLSPSQSCDRFDGCRDCTAASGCGWCSSSRLCLPGGPTGDCAASCPTLADWNYANCSHNCPYFTGCAECIADPNDDCLFCHGEDVCASALDLVPGKCRCPQSPQGGETCAAAIAHCDDHQNCGSCAADPACGWCVEGDTCLPIDPNDKEPCQVDECPLKEWVVEKDSCPAAPKNCSLLSGSCGECTQAFASDGCMWCESRGICYAPDEYSNCPACLESVCPDCSAHQGCAECVADPVCGYCASSKSCLPGSKSGPCGGVSGSCPAPDWGFDSCAVACREHDSCAECTGAAGSDGCAWCVEEEICGTLAQLNDSACNCPIQDACPADCSTYSGTTCGDCTAQTGCGWCPETSSCLAGDETAPCSSSEGCKVGWSFGNCDGTCEGNTKCGSCVASDPKTQCGWCAGTQAHKTALNPISLCVQGSGAGPTDMRQCARWYPPGATGTCPVCESHTDCRTCAADPACGWCGDGCRAGDSNGPFDATGCSSWSYADCQAECVLNSLCGDCVLQPECGWCKNPLHIAGFCAGVDSASQCYEFYQDSCAGDCGAALVCSACAANSSCGWCESKSSSSGSTTASCVLGTGQGPKGTTCSIGWSYGSGSCISSCGKALDCGSCLLDADCGWCDGDGGACRAGKFDGPDHGSCPIDEWTHAPSVCSVPFDDCASRTDCPSCTKRNSCGWCAEDRACYTGNKNSPLAPNTCPSSSWRFVGCPSPSSPPKKPLSPWIVSAITLGAVAVPITIISVILYRKWVQKYGYPPLE